MDGSEQNLGESPQHLEELEGLICSPEAGQNTYLSSHECDGYRYHKPELVNVRTVENWPEEWRRSLNGRLYIPQDTPTMDDWFTIPHVQMKMVQFGADLPADFVSVVDGTWSIDFTEAQRLGIQYYDPRMHDAMRNARNVPTMLKAWREKTLRQFRSLRNNKERNKQDFSALELIPIMPVSAPPANYANNNIIPGSHTGGVVAVMGQAMAAEESKATGLLPYAMALASATRKACSEYGTVEEIDEAFSVTLLALQEMAAHRDRFREVYGGSM